MKGEELIKKCQKGDAKAQSILYDRYATPMYRLCCRYIKDQFEAEDVLVRGGYKMFRSIGSFHYQDDIRLLAWLRKVMVNECLMQLRQSSSLTSLNCGVATFLMVTFSAGLSVLPQFTLNALEATLFHVI